MALSYPDVTVTTSWVNIAAAGGNPALSNQPVLIQRKDGQINPVFVYFGGASAPSANDAGIELLSEGDSVNGTATQIWVRSAATGARIYAGLMDS